MRRFKRIHDVCRAGLLALVAVLTTAAVGKGQTEVNMDRTPNVNVVFLDDGALRVDAASRVKRNDWREWKQRVPTFLGLLHDFVAALREAGGDQISKDDSLFTLEVSASLSPEQKDKVIAGELRRIFEATGRPSSILARSTAGDDQLRLAFQDDKDYRPEHAARFLREFARVSPVIAHSGIAAHFGPFQPPPTIVFDPRPNEAVPRYPSARAKQRWGLVEEESYLLPHYLLHCLTVLNLDRGYGESTFYAESKPEPGNVTHQFIMGGNREQQQNLASLVSPGSRVVTLDDYRQNGRSYLNQNVVITASATHDGIRGVNQAIQWQKQNNVRSDFNALYFDAARIASKSEVRPNGGLIRSFEPSTGGGVLNLGMPGARNVYQNIGRWIDNNSGEAYVSRTKFNRAEIDAMASGLTRGGKLIEVRRDQFQMGGGISGGVGPFSAGLGANGPVYRSITETPDNKGYVFRHQAGGLQAMGVQSPEDMFRNGGRGFARLPSLPSPGGILFNKKNLYMLDLTGKVAAWSEQSEAAYRAEQVFHVDGSTEGMISAGRSIYGKNGKPPAPRQKAETIAAEDRLRGNLFFAELDLKSPRIGSLPFAVPRFLKPQPDASPSFGGPWTLEPVTASGLDRLASSSMAGSEQRPQVSVLPTETQSRLVYTADRLEVPEDAANQPARREPIKFVRSGNQFQPNLIDNADGTYSWVLRHGVTIRLDSAGLVRAIREPDGHAVSYLRDGNRHLSGKQATDGRTIRIAYENGLPVKASIAEGVVHYAYAQGLLQTVTQGARVTSFVYENQRLTRWTLGSGEIVLIHDSQGHLKSLTTGSRTVAVKYAKQRNAIQFTDGAKTMEWRFGPRGDVVGVVEGSQAVLWTRSADHRIIQVAFGHLEDEPGSPFKKFSVTDTIGTDPTEAF
jgi:hypothetical protein